MYQDASFLAAFPRINRPIPFRQGGPASTAQSSLPGVGLNLGLDEAWTRFA